MDAFLVRDAERMMLSAVLTEDGIGLTFADGCRGVVPFVDPPELGEPSDVHTLELPNPYEMILTTARGERVEFPWDFVRHCDRSHRPMVEAIALQGRRAPGERVRGFRESAGMTQKALAMSAGIGRVALVRVENGEQTPRYRTLEGIAESLGRPVRDLVSAEELIQ